MNWYKLAKMKFAQHGEWWIQDGTAMFADGDISDQNHEAYVIDMLMQNLAELFNISYNEMMDWDTLGQAIIKEILDSTSEEERPQLEIQAEDNPEGFILQQLLSDGVENAQDMMDMIRGAGDARDYAMEHWGWKRLDDLNVETWNLTPSDMDDISRGIWDAYQDEINDETPVRVYVHSTGQWHDLTIGDLDAGQVKQPLAVNQQGTQDAYDQAVRGHDKPSNPYYKDWE
jgi:hypothetical protein